MDDFQYLEEPPPIYRDVTHVATEGKPGLLGVWLNRPSGSRRHRDVGPPPRTTSPRTSSRRRVVMGIAAVAVLAMQGWMLYALVRARSDLSHVSQRLEEARGSLGVVWEATKRLDEERAARLAMLTDSIRWVFDYAQGEVRLWEASYASLGQRVDDNFRKTTKNDTAIMRIATALRNANTRLDGFARADQDQRFKLDALGRTQNQAVDALVRRTQLHEASMHDVTVAVSSLRDMLGKIDSDVGNFQQRLTASTSAYGQLGRRMDNLSGFADGFRRAGLSGEALQGQLSSLSDEIRRIRVRVDSLRSVNRAVVSTDYR